jgi:hypothetical protein
LTADKENAHLMEEVSTLHFNTIWWTNLWSMQHTQHITCFPITLLHKIITSFQFPCRWLLL